MREWGEYAAQELIKIIGLITNYVIDIWLYRYTDIVKAFIYVL
jgi:hypothetical protein